MTKKDIWEKSNKFLNNHIACDVCGKVYKEVLALDAFMYDYLLKRLRPCAYYLCEKCFCGKEVNVGRKETKRKTKP